MEIQEMIEVLTAFKEGKEVERHVSADYWVSLSDNHFDFTQQEYRIKPEYVPFTWEDRDLFRDKWIRLKNAENEYRINFIGSSDNISCANWKEPMTLISLFKSHEFIDGSIFGKLK